MRKLPRKIRLLVSISALFTLAIALSVIFVNVYFWKQHESIKTIAWYTGIQFLMMPTMFWLARTLHPTQVEPFLRIGILLHILFFGLVLWIGQKSNPLLLGIVLGSGQGLYWFSFNLLSFRIANAEQRATFNSLVGGINSLSNFLAPLVSGFLIKYLQPGRGFQVIFTFSLLLFASALLISVRLRGEQFLDDPAPLFQRHHPAWSRLLIGSLFQGLREGVFSFLTVILVYLSTSNITSLAMFIALTSLISSVAYVLTGRWLRLKGYNESMLIGSFCSLAAVGLFLYDVKYWTLLVYGILTALCTPLFNIPFGTRVFQVIEEADEKFEREYMTEREIMLNLGRVLSIFSFIATYTFLDKRWLPTFLLVIGSMQVVAAFIMKTVHVNVHRAR